MQLEENSREDGETEQQLRGIVNLLCSVSNSSMCLQFLSSRRWISLLFLLFERASTYARSKIATLLRTAMQTRPVYVTPEIEPEFTAGLQRVPVGPLLRLYADTLFHPTPRPEFDYRPIVREDDYGRRLRLLYAEALMARARYYLAHGNSQEAQESAAEAARHRPQISISR